jgi:hypothetical protein
MPERLTPENCTCGAKLVANSRFCHMCGRPVFEDPTPEVAPLPTVVQQAVPSQSAAARPGPAVVGFSNPVALRVAVLISLATMLVEMIPGMSLLFILWTLAAGWCAVLLYRRFTGYTLSVRAGARLGSITGVLTFVSLLVSFTLTVAVVGKDALLQQIKQGNPEAAQVFNDPPALIAALLMALVILLAIVVGTCAAGGALGARYVSRNSANHRV